MTHQLTRIGREAAAIPTAEITTRIACHHRSIQSFSSFLQAQTDFPFLAAVAVLLCLLLCCKFICVYIQVIVTVRCITTEHMWYMGTAAANEAMRAEVAACIGPCCVCARAVNDVLLLRMCVCAAWMKMHSEWRRRASARLRKVSASMS